MADNIRFTNIASAKLLSPINNSVLTPIALQAGQGALFPAISGSQYFMVAIQNAAGDLEIAKVIARSGDNLTFQARGAEGTTGLAFSAGDRVELRLTALVMQEMLQKNGGTMTGDVDFDEKNLVDPYINGPNARMTNGQIVGVPIRGDLGDVSNQILVPSGGGRATASGYSIITQQDLLSNGGLNLLPINTILLWYGILANLPAGWAVCDGSNGTPDLRDRFVVGVGPTYPVGTTGGASTATGDTGASGAHTHIATVAEHVMTAENLVAHQHVAPYAENGTNPFGNEGVFGKHGSGDSDSDNWWAHTSEGFKNNTKQSGAGSEPLLDVPDGHTHATTIPAAVDHTHTLATTNVIPPYKAVYYVMRYA